MVTPAKRLIDERGLSYPDLAREIGITPQSVYAIVQGRAKGATGRYAIAKALGVDVADLWPEPEEAAA